MSKIEVNGLITLNDAHVHQRRGVTASRTYRLGINAVYTRLGKNSTRKLGLSKMGRSRVFAEQIGLILFI